MADTGIPQLRLIGIDWYQDAKDRRRSSPAIDMDGAVAHREDFYVAPVEHWHGRGW